MTVSLDAVARFGCRLLWGKATGKAYPFLVQLNVTNRCNYRCSYCYGTYFDRSQNEMNIEQVNEVIDQLADQGLFRLNLVGGEPLLREDIEEIISHASKHGIVCAMTTNGKLVPRRIKELKGLETICFSLDGREKNNDQNRVKGSHKAVMEGLAVCREHGVNVQLSAVLTKHTVDDVEYLVDLARQHHCLVGFATLISQERESYSTEHDLYPDRKKLRQALNKIVQLKNKGAPILFSSKVYQYARDWPVKTNIIMGKRPPFEAIPCLAGKYFGLIDYNGNVFPCPQLMGIIQPGNVLRDGVKQAFAKSSKHGCTACSVPCSNDFSRFFGLNPSAVCDMLLSRIKN